MYQVWTKEGYEEAWRLTECPDIAAVENIIRDNFGMEVEVKVSTPVEYDARIAVKIHAPKDQPTEKAPPPAPEPEIKEEAQIEATESETKPDKGAGAKGHSKVR